MKVLVTGGLGGIGRHLCRLLLDAGIDVTIYHRFPTKSLKYALWFPRKKIVWGDIKDIQKKRDLLAEQDAVIHLAYLLPPDSEDNPEKAREVNVNATERLVRTLEEVNPNCRLIFTSSVMAFGITKDEEPPITVDHPLNPHLHYSQHKAECEEIIKSSSLNQWIILRIAEALYLEVIPSPRNISRVYEIPWDQRIEFVHIDDVALALKNALYTEQVRDTYIVAGGERCQMHIHDQMKRMFKIFHMPPPPKNKFTLIPYSLDWYDTKHSQAVLLYQNKGFDQYLADLKKTLGWRTKFYWVVSPFSRLYLRWSPPAADRVGAKPDIEENNSENEDEKNEERGSLEPVSVPVARL
jgi:nucleoside-diphosphate-sugar epimerase